MTIRLPSRFSRIASIAALLATLTAADAVRAGGMLVDTAFAYQGRLLEDALPAGPVAISFTLWDAENGGTLLGSSGLLNVVPDDDGLFTVCLDFGAAAFDGGNRWLQVTVEGLTLTPRQQIKAAPYALQTRGMFVDDAGRVGIGTLDTNQAVLNVGQDADNSVSGLAVTNAGATLSMRLWAEATRGHLDANSVGSAPLILNVGGGPVSIGTVNTNTGHLAVRQPQETSSDGISVIDSTFVRGLRLWVDSDLNSHVDSGGTGAAPLVLNAGGGSVGVGTTTPAAQLDVDLNDTGAPDPAVRITSNSNDLAHSVLEVIAEGAGAFAAGEFRAQRTGVYADGQAAGSRGVQAWATGSGSYPLWVEAYAADGLPGEIAIFRANGFTEARVDNTGRGFFNGGTQTGGADVAEAFEVEGDVAAYEPGDVLVISTNADRTVALGREPYSTLVVGVHATKPGVLLTERDIAESLDDTVPMGIVGVIPTKVSAENGPIRRGDLLVTSSTPGHAMKGTDRARMVGAIIGKALENFEEPGTGVIKVMVNVK